MSSNAFIYECNSCRRESVNGNEFAFCGREGFKCTTCVEKEQEDRKQKHLANSPIERELIQRGYGTIEGYAIIPCIEQDDIPEAVEFDTPETNYWDLVHYGRVLKTYRTNLEEAFQAYLKCGNNT